MRDGSSNKPLTHRRQGQDLAAYLRQVSDVPDQAFQRMRKSVGLAIRYGTTPRQREILSLYYGQGLNTRQIAEELHLNQSSVSRTLRRGEARICQCLLIAGHTPPDLRSLRRHPRLRDLRKKATKQD